MLVAVLYGGDSCEKEVSVITGMQVMNALKGRHKIVPVYMTDEGFFSPKDACSVSTYLGSKARRRKVYWAGRGLYRKVCGMLVPYARPDCVLVCTHGGSGENGEVQGMLSVSGLPYTCADVEGSAVGMDKELTKRLFETLGLNVARWKRYGRDLSNAEVAVDAVASIGLPLCVKPCRQGSSIGVTVCGDETEVQEAVETARCFDDKILIERAFTKFSEINCACLTKDGEVVVSETERVVPWREMLSYEDKYLRGAKNAPGRECPADIPEETAAEIKAATEAVYRALGGRGVIRVDYFVEGGKVFAGEVNTVPGSLAAYLFKPLGMSAADVADALIAQAVDQNGVKKYEFDSPLLFRYLNASSNACKIAGKII